MTTSEQVTKTLCRAELPQALDPKHIQEILGIGRRQTYELLEEPPFHTVRIGRTIKISKKAFFTWFDGMEYIDGAEEQGN